MNSKIIMRLFIISLYVVWVFLCVRWYDWDLVLLFYLFGWANNLERKNK